MNAVSFLSEAAQEAVYAIAYTSFRQGQYREAVSLFCTLTAANPRSVKFWIGLGACYQAKKEYQQAIDSYEKVAMLTPNSPLVHLYAANCFFSLRQAKKGLLALNWAEMALSGLPAEKRRHLKAHISLLRQAWKKEATHG